MLSCKDVAKYLLALADDEESGELISNLKLQKLLYYSQGFYLAKYDQPLFEAAIEAWALGPVVPEIYREYKKYGSNAIKAPKNIDYSIFNEQERDLLNEVYAVYGQYSAWKLSQMTHEEPPWKRYQGKSDNTITHQALKKYFLTQLL